MKAADKLKAALGANIQESMGSVLLDGDGGAGGGMPDAPRPAAPDRYQGLQRAKGAFLVPPDRLTPDPRQPRKEFTPEALEQLAHSLKERGQLQPIRVRWDAAMERWVIIAGERRWRAAVQAGLPTIAAVEATGPLTDDEILEDQLIENCLREDLKPVEQAKAYQALLSGRGLSQRQLAERLRISQATIARCLALLNLPAELQESVESGDLSPNAAYQLSKVADPAEQRELARESIEGRLKRDDLEERTRANRPRTAGKPRPWTFATDRVKVTLAPRRKA